MPILSKPSAEARVAIFYITGGAVLDVWSTIWFFYMRNHPPAGSVPDYVCAGLFFTGLVLVVIGLALGRIGRSARQAELPPQEVTQQVARADQDAAARAPMIAPVNPTAAPAPANGPVVAANPAPPPPHVPQYVQGPPPRSR